MTDSVGQIVISVILIAALIAIGWVAVSAMGIPIPMWFWTIVLIIVIAVVAVLAVKLLLRIMKTP